MYHERRREIFEAYTRAKEFFVHNPRCLVELECYITTLINNVIDANYAEIESDYNEASFLHPFWANYPPEDRGRAPVGDQVPWIEVGEHAVGHKLCRLISLDYEIAEVGLPSGADNRFVIYSERISQITNHQTNKAFVFLDIKSVGPRDNFDHTVLSPYQVSGDGMWINPEESMSNSPIIALGRTASHPFYPAISPIYAFPDGSFAPTIHIFIKPVYTMLSMHNGTRVGQPLDSIISVCVPNGILLALSPNYLQRYPGLFFPGKDDKKKDPQKIRARVSFEILRQINRWRVTEF